MRNRWSNNPGGSCGLFLGIFFIAFSRLALAETAPRLSAFLNKEEIQVGEGVTLTVSVQWVGEASAFEFDLPPLPELHLLQAAGSSQKSAAYRQEGRLEQLHSFLFDLKAQKKGRAEIGAVLVKYRRPGEEE
jgi:hypothetical protein